MINSLSFPSFRSRDQVVGKGRQYGQLGREAALVMQSLFESRKRIVSEKAGREQNEGRETREAKWRREHST